MAGSVAGWVVRRGGVWEFGTGEILLLLRKPGFCRLVGEMKRLLSCLFGLECLFCLPFQMVSSFDLP